MLFHSLEFLLLFLPITLAGFFLASRFGGLPGAIAWLCCASLIFYASWDIWLVALFLVSVLINFATGAVIASARSRHDNRRSSWWLTAGICANLLILACFKYANFFIDNINALGASGIPHLDLIFPIGVSFYTFIQIGYLIDLRNGQVGRVPFSQYLLFAGFFPYITAGPIVLQREIFPQYREDQITFNLDRVFIGLTLFSIGLFKKLVLADGVAPFANAAFATAT